MPKRQNITISSRAGNARVEAAIPTFMDELGMDRDQATAVAIRLESVGRLIGDGLIEPNTEPKGAAKMMLKAIGATTARGLKASPPPEQPSPEQELRAITQKRRVLRRRR